MTGVTFVPTEEQLRRRIKELETELDEARAKAAHVEIWED